MTLREKFDKILKHNKLDLHSIEDIALYCEIKAGTIYKAIQRNEEKDGDLGTETTKTLVDTIGINWDWWEQGIEPIFTEKHTPAIKNNKAAVHDEQQKEPASEEVRLLIKNIDRMGELNIYLLTRVKVYEEKLRSGGIDPATI